MQNEEKNQNKQLLKLAVMLLMIMGSIFLLVAHIIPAIEQKNTGEIFVNLIVLTATGFLYPIAIKNINKL